jgi:hypothetical protein
LFKQHPYFRNPSNQTKVWRYVDFTKFVSLLDTKSLYFSLIDKLEDKFEGSITQADFEREISNLNSLMNFAPDFADVSLEIHNEHSDMRRLFRKIVYVNCWHMNEHESQAMWKLYVKTRKGIAIQTTFKRLSESFSESEESVYIGEINYSPTTSKPNSHFIRPFLHKLPSFEYEHELRAVISKIPIEKPEIPPYVTEPISSGEFVRVNLDTLMEQIVVSPESGDGFFDLVKSVTEKYLSKEFSKRVVKTDLDKDPLF